MIKLTLNILLVDDEIELCTLFKTFLINCGYDAVSNSNPVIALEYFKETSDNHSLIITDLRMPGMCGIDLANKIREIDSKIRIFLMTAFEIKDLEDRPDFKLARINRLLQKPIHFSEGEIINDTWKN